MIEIPEAITIAGQINDILKGKKVIEVTAIHTPHKLAWYYGEPQNYQALLEGKTIGKAEGFGSMVQIQVEDAFILANEGAGLRFHKENESRPQKHQLLIEFDDSSAISISVQMYGGIGCFKAGEIDNIYYKLAKDRPSPLSEKFDRNYFDGLILLPEVQKMSAKAFLATEQRIPGLGNGVLQDILYNAKIHPKRKIRDLSQKDKDNIFKSIKETLAEMTFQGGRDTEKDFSDVQEVTKPSLAKIHLVVCVMHVVVVL